MEYSSIFVCLMGMGTVFFGLICLIALTYLMSAVVGRGKKAAPELETYKEQFKDIAKSEEDVLSLALFPQVAPKFLAWRDGPHEAPAQPAEAPKAPPADPNAVRELYVEYKF